jgi:HSP20 family protein
MSELIRYEGPETFVSPFFDDCDCVEDSFFDRWDREMTGTMWPRIDIIEEPKSFILKADLPGLGKDDISINVDGRTLTISGEKEETKQDRKKGNYYHLERSFGSFRRSFSLPAHVDEKKIDAHYKNGVLELTLTKTGEAVSKAIEVKVD